jgi:hypothetical protein
MEDKKPKKLFGFHAAPALSQVCACMLTELVLELIGADFIASG